MKKARAAKQAEQWGQAAEAYDDALLQKPNDPIALKEKKAVQGSERPFVNGAGMKFVRIPPPGEKGFWMGSNADDKAASADEKPRHRVSLSQGFFMGVHEVTQKQYRAVMGSNPSHFSKDGRPSDRGTYDDHSRPAGGKGQVEGMDTDDFPVENVSWDDAQEFLTKLNDRAEEKQKGRTYRLPTEAEWEYACRAGADVQNPFTFTRPSSSITAALANFDGNSPLGDGDKGPFLRRTTKVGSYEPNPFGLYDMHGNVWEWCADWYDSEAYRQKNRKDPRGPQEGKYRVLRGGSWGCIGLLCRSAFRGGDTVPGKRGRGFGFRVVCVAAGA